MNHTGTNESESSDAGDRIVEQELRRLLESPLFVRSPVLSRLLQYLADHRLPNGPGQAEMGRLVLKYTAPIDVPVQLEMGRANILRQRRLRRRVVAGLSRGLIG